MNLLIFFYIFYLGCIVGSFLNVLILRLPEEQVIGGRSHCMHCKHVLSPMELIPLFSYIFLRGKCRNCKMRISPRYFYIEFITGLLFVLGLFTLQHNTVLQYENLIEYFFVASVCTAIFVIDLEHFLILDVMVYPALAIVLAVAGATDIFHHPDAWQHSALLLSFIGAVVGSAPFYALNFFSDGRLMGFGDVKLLLFLGAAVRWPNIFTAIFVAVILGGVVSVGLLVFGGKHLKSQVPFGTFLTVGALVVLLWGPKLLQWYLAMLGF